MLYQSIPIFVGGILLFLFSLSRLGNIIQLAISNRIRDYIKFAVQRKINGLISGLILTLFFQSSSATSLLAVSMVSAGLISLSASLPVILGSDIATTLTAQLVVWKVTELSPIILASGLIIFFLPEENSKRYGEAVFYFGLMLFGLMLMSRGTDFLKESTLFSQAILKKRTPTSVFALSFLFTVIVQSSAIPISMAIIMAQKGLIGIDIALPVVLGANLGTTGTAFLGSLVAGWEGKKVALAHILFKFVGVIVVLPLLGFCVTFLQKIPVQLPQKIALSHFFFNLFICVFFYPILGFITRILDRLVPFRGRSFTILPEYLDRSFLKDPEEALLCVKKELLRQMVLSKTMVEDSLALISDFKKLVRRNINYLESVVDNLQNEIIRYLWEVSSFELGQQESRKLFAYTGMVHNIERIADHALNIAEIAEIKRKKRTFFSDAAIKELNQISEKLRRSLEQLTLVLEKGGKSSVAELKNETEEIEMKLRDALNNHLERFYCKICQREAGPLFVDLLTNMEGISRHIRFISERIKEAYQLD